MNPPPLASTTSETPPATTTSGASTTPHTENVDKDQNKTMNNNNISINVPVNVGNQDHPNAAIMMAAAEARAAAQLAQANVKALESEFRAESRMARMEAAVTKARSDAQAAIATAHAGVQALASQYANNPFAGLRYPQLLNNNPSPFMEMDQFNNFGNFEFPYTNCFDNGLTGFGGLFQEQQDHVQAATGNINTPGVSQPGQPVNLQTGNANFQQPMASAAAVTGATSNRQIVARTRTTTASGPNRLETQVRTPIVRTNVQPMQATVGAYNRQTRNANFQQPLASAEAATPRALTNRQIQDANALFGTNIPLPATGAASNRQTVAATITGAQMFQRLMASAAATTAASSNRQTVARAAATSAPNRRPEAQVRTNARIAAASAPNRPETQVRTIVQPMPAEAATGRTSNHRQTVARTSETITAAPTRPPITSATSISTYVTTPLSTYLNVFFFLFIVKIWKFLI